MYDSSLSAPAPLSPRERQILERLVAAQSMKEIAASLGIAPSTVKEHVKAIYTKARVHSARDLMARHFGQQAEWAGRGEVLRAMLDSANMRGLQVRLLAALRVWTGAAQGFCWEIASSDKGFVLVGQSGLIYPVRNDGLVPRILRMPSGSTPVVLADSEAVHREEWAIVASAEAGALPFAGDVLALVLVHTAQRWLVILGNTPSGRFDEATIGIAKALVGMAEASAASWADQLQKPPMAAAAGHNGGGVRRA